MLTLGEDVAAVAARLAPVKSVRGLLGVDAVLISADNKDHNIEPEQ